MVTGVNRFRAHFADHEHQYVLIGGAACELIMDDAGLDFRATKDLDIVLIVEALDPAFSAAFMAFVEAGGYEIQQRSEGQRSEEHTSELQSLMRISYAVFCLKKKKKITHTISKHNNITHNTKL